MKMRNPGAKLCPTNIWLSKTTTAQIKAAKWEKRNRKVMPHVNLVMAQTRHQVNSNVGRTKLT